MTGLIYKELLTHKKQLFAVLAVVLFFTGWNIVPPLTAHDLTAQELTLFLGLSMISVISVGAFEQGIFESDEIKIWQSYIASSPDGVRLQIASKYIFNAALTLAVVFLLEISFYISGAINGSDVSVCNTILILLASTQFILRAVETPFIVRFGSKMGNMYRMILISVLTTVATMYGLFGDLSVFGGSFGEVLVRFMDIIRDKTSYILWFYPVVSLVLYWISCHISYRFYLKGGEHYDK